jgi:hypothetical protein
MGTQAGRSIEKRLRDAAIAQIKPTISRAMTVVTTTFGLPDAAKRRYRPHSRT